MKIINNKKGSALLWCILMLIILTILLGSILTATYAYYTYTMNTVKRQQAYFTSRSAISVILEELTSEEQVRVSGQYAESTIPIMPSGKGEANAVEINDFGFSERMGTAEAKLVLNDDDRIDISVTSYYPDKENGEKYVMKATVVRQPLYFGGIAVKHLTLNGNLTLGENTDFYWNNTDTFNTLGNGTSLKNNTASTIQINGNLVTKKDAVITPNNIVAGRKFYGTATFSGNGLHSKKIWSPTEYIISNKELKVDDDTNTEYSTNFINTLKNLTSTHSYYCNSNGNPTVFGRVSLTGRESFLLQLTDALGLGNITNDIADDRFKLTNSENDALAIQYIEILSLSTTVSNAIEDYKNGTRSIIGGMAASTIQNLYDQVFSNFALKCLDVSFIDFQSNDENNRYDEVVPLTYMFVRGGSHTGLRVRVRYGCDPGSRNAIGRAVDTISGNVSNFINGIFDIHNKPSYIVVYLEENGVIELGYDDDGRRVPNKDSDLVFLYSIYGGDNTTVILHDGVIVVGEIICDNLQIMGNSKVVYSSVNGGQVAKQKIAEYWAVSNYSD